MSRAPSSDRGFTLVEVVLALSLLCIGLLAVATGIASLSRMVNEGRSRSEVASLLISELGRVRVEGCNAAAERVEDPYTLRVMVSPASAGRLVTLAVSRRSGRGLRTDSIRWFQRCETA
jgi:prepilin-type N-terminal cleavage/methylation domain-containing protein